MLFFHLYNIYIYTHQVSLYLTLFFFSSCQFENYELSFIYIYIYILDNLIVGGGGLYPLNIRSRFWEQCPNTPSTLN